MNKVLPIVKKVLDEIGDNRIVSTIKVTPIYITDDANKIVGIYEG
tara:strand:- start:8979 stop:9113 length:135 start_codon:yes stop_codon:yes gene_type:complete